MRLDFKYLFITAWICCSAINNPWELRKDESGIKVYVRSNEESSFDEFKAEMVLTQTSLKSANEVLVNVEEYESWFPDCSEASVIRQDDKETVYIIRTDSPWPADDRCGMYIQTVSCAEDDLKCEFVFVAEPNEEFDLAGMVRITEAWGKWTLEQIGADLKVTYQFKGNPGGSIPAWLANSFVVKHPFETMQSFREQCAP